MIFSTRTRSIAVGILCCLAGVAGIINNWLLARSEAESASPQHWSVALNDTNLRPPIESAVDHPLNVLTSHTSVDINTQTSGTTRTATAYDSGRRWRRENAGLNPVGEQTRYVALIAPQTDVLMTQHSVGGRVGNGISSYLSMMAVAHALDRTLVIIDTSDFPRLLNLFWRPPPNVANMSLLPPQSWVLCTSWKDDNCSHHAIPVTFPPWPPAQWPSLPSTCRTNASLANLQDDLSCTNSAIRCCRQKRRSSREPVGVA